MNETIGRIKKRDGRVVVFDAKKITKAINSAFKVAYPRENFEKESGKLCEKVIENLKKEKNAAPGVEHIQDIVEDVLMKSGHTEVARKYIIYRAERSRERERDSKLMRVYKDITFKSAADSDVKRENANIDGDTAMGSMLKYGAEGAKQFNEIFVIRPDHAKAHKDGLIHIHDMDFYTLTTTCCQIDLIKLFNNGFSTGHGALREPNHIASYAALCCIAIQSNQNDQHGGQSIVNFDYAMALGVAKTFVHLYKANFIRALQLLCEIEKPEIEFPKDAGVPCLDGNDEYKNAERELLIKFLEDNNITDIETVCNKVQDFAQNRAEKETDRATYKAMVGLVHNLNTMHSRAGAQTPFSTINYGMDTTSEGKCAIRNLLLATEAGLGHGETPIFPIQIFRVKEGVNYNPEDPNYYLFKLAIRVSAKRLFPNFSFLDAPFNLKYYKNTPETEIAYMGCRTRVIGNVYDPSREVSNGRGNLSFTSINLPRLAIEAHGNIEMFFNSLGKTIDIVIDQLFHRFAIQCEKKVKNFLFLMGQGVWIDSENLQSLDSDIAEVLKHGTLSVGFIGLAETLTALVGKHHGEDEEAQRLGLDIISFMRARCDEESAKRHLNVTLIATPAEGLSGRFVKIDREKFGEIAGVTDKDYYTNSFHIPVGYKITAYNKIHREAPYHELTNAGHITYIEMDGDPSQNLDAFEQVIREMKNANIGYGSINHPVDRDPVCGFAGIIGNQCPGCGRTEDDGVKFTRIRRITGYLVGTLDRFNDAKQAEERDRVKHTGRKGEFLDTDGE